MSLSKLLFSFALLALSSAASSSPDESKYILLPREYHNCELSPDGRYTAIYRRILDSPEEFAKPGGRSVYRTRIYILDLETNNLVLAGPPEKKGPRRNKDDWVDRATWAAGGAFLILTNSEVMSVDPATGSPTERFNIHATLRKEISLPLADSLDKPLLFYGINWSRGASVTFYSLFPRTGKIRRFAEPGRVKDLAVGITPPNGNQALSLRAYSKGTDQGYTWELDGTGELQVYPLELDPEWRNASVATSICREGERVMARYRETGDAVAELRLHNYRSNEFLGASVLVPRAFVDIASTLLTSASIDRMRQAGGTLPFQEVAPAPVLSLVGQLRDAYPLASVRILNTSADGSKVSLSVSAQNRPAAYFVFDTIDGKLRKVTEAYPDWAEREKASGSFVPYRSSHERGGVGAASYLPALNASSPADTLVQLSAEPIFDFDWGFSSANRFLSAEGFDTLHIIIPWSLQIALTRASTPDQMESAQQNCREFIATVLQAAREKAALQGKVYFALRGSAAALYPSLPQLEGLQVEKVFIANPRFHAGLADSSLSRMVNLNNYPFKRYVDPETWSTLVEQRRPELDVPVVTIWRENDPWWHRENGAEEQIRAFERYCENVGVAFELDRWSEGRWRSLEPWKLNAAITIDTMDHIRGTSSGILEAWR